MKNALKTHRIEGKHIETGNLIFQEGSRKEKFFIMFAVTLKSFENLQFLGVEMFYEFLDNLDLFNDLSQKYKLKFLIKLPPNFEKNISLLKKCFKNLKFINSDLRKNLEKCLLTISYSSTVIEDSLHCGVPVILFDRWKRYQHCNSQNDPKTKNSAIYYVTNEKNLLETIESIKKSDNINFSEYIYQTKSQQNIKNLFSQIIK